jgi:glycosyltransferase involved in cell wall biosynthesis
MASPLVSVIVPAFNAETTLREAVESALGGSYSKIEVIIVDDGSTDATARIAVKLANGDPRVSVHRRGNGGVSAAFNSGLALAAGDYVARLDADDLWHPAKLERQVEAARRNPDAAFIYTWVRYIDGDGQVRRDAPPQRFPPHALCRGIYESLIGANSSALIRREVIQQFGGYDESLSSCEDLLLQLHVSAMYPVDYVPQYLVGYRVRPDSLSEKPDNVLANWRKALERLRIQFPQVPRFVRDWVHGRRCTELAESFAWRGDYRMCAQLLLEALRHDPKRTSRLLAYRIGRFVARRLFPRRSLEPEPLFLDCDPTKDFRPAEQVLPGLENERIARLTALDEELAR